MTAPTKGQPKMKIALDTGAIMPTRAHPYDAGLDLYTPKDVMVWEHHKDGCAVIDTGVHVEIPEGYVGLIKSKSGLYVRHGLTCEGVIDAHYTGSIVAKLINHSPIYHFFAAGDKIAQLVIVPCLLPDLEVVERLDSTDRGANGFGSTGK